MAVITVKKVVTLKKIKKITAGMNDRRQVGTEISIVFYFLLNFRIVRVHGTALFMNIYGYPEIFPDYPFRHFPHGYDYLNVKKLDCDISFALGLAL